MTLPQKQRFETAVRALQGILDELQDKYDNMSDAARESESGDALSTQIDALDAALGSLAEIET